MRVHDRWLRARFRERTWRGGRRSCLGTTGGGTGGESQERRTRRCSRPRGPLGIPGCVAHAAPAAAELGRSAAGGGWLAYAGGIPMTVRPLLAALAILVVWTLLDFLLHRLLLAPIYDASPGLWRPFDQMNIALVYTVIFVLTGVYVGAYKLLVSPKSLRAGVLLGACLGLAFGVAVGFGACIHLPICLALAWDWFFRGGLAGRGGVGAA